MLNQKLSSFIEPKIICLFLMLFCTRGVGNYAMAQCPFVGVPVLSVTKSPVCAGDTMKFVVAFSTIRGVFYGYQYQLYVNGLLVSNGTEIFATQLQPSDVVTSQITYNGCVSAVSNQLTGLSFNPLVMPSVSISSSQNGPFCPGTAITYTATTVNGGANPSYSWQVNGVFATHDSVFTSSTLKDGDKVNCILGVNSIPCLLARSVASDTLTAHFVSINPAPAVTISASANNVYRGTPIIFTAAATNNGNPTTYQWQVNGVNIGADSTIFTSSTLNNGDEVSCVISTVTNTGCTVTAKSNIIPMVIKPPPPITAPNTFTPNGDGINDTWKISGLSFYSNILIKVFNRYGTVVYQSHGYPTPWDGTGSNKRPLPDGIYYYIISTDDKNNNLSGWLAIIR